MLLSTPGSKIFAGHGYHCLTLDDTTTTAIPLPTPTNQVKERAQVAREAKYSGWMIKKCKTKSPWQEHFFTLHKARTLNLRPCLD